MGVRLTCDRCGAEIDGERAHTALWLMPSDKFGPRIGAVPHSWDLCDGCRDEFAEWMDARRDAAAGGVGDGER